MSATRAIANGFTAINFSIPRLILDFNSTRELFVALNNEPLGGVTYYCQFGDSPGSLADFFPIGPGQELIIQAVYRGDPVANEAVWMYASAPSQLLFLIAN